MTLPLAILHVLVAARRAIPAEAIRRDADAFVHRVPTLADVEKAIRTLEEADPPLVKGTGTPLRGTVWTATTEGRLEVLA